MRRERDMFRTRGRRLIAVVAIELIAVGVGVGAALTVHAQSVTDVATAASHCTRYNPTVSTDYNCYVYMNPILSFAETPSVARRDSNHISRSAASSWGLWYRNLDGATLNYAGGSSCCGSISNSGGQYVYSACSSGQTQVSGECDTTWHD
jgi:hypothetical protein